MRIQRHFSILILLLFCSVVQVKAQGVYGKKIQDNFPTTNEYKPGGWQFAPGLAWMMPNPLNGTSTYQLAEDTINQYTFDRKGKLGLYLDVGRYRITDDLYYIRWIDYGLHYKSLKGSTDVDVVKMVESTEEELATRTASGEFKDKYIGAYFNAYFAKSITKYEFITHGPGVNLGYAVGQKRVATQLPGEVFPGKFIAQFHYRVGLGIKASNSLIVIPTLETPIFTGWEFDKARSSTAYFPTRYRPIIISVKFLFLDPVRDVCPPVLNPDLPKDFIPDGSMDVPGY